jgi:hypothetical protein
VQSAVLVLILRSVRDEVVPQTRTCVHASRRMRTASARALMLRDASQRVRRSEGPASRRAAMLLSMRAARFAAHFGETNPTLLNPVVPAIATLGRDDTGLVMTPTCGCRKASPGSAPLFRACSLQGTVQLQRVEVGTGHFWPNEPTRLSLGSPLRKRHFCGTTAEERTEQTKPTVGQLKA